MEFEPLPKIVVVIPISDSVDFLSREEQNRVFLRVHKETTGYIKDKGYDKILTQLMMVRV